MSSRIPPDAFDYYVALGPDRSYRAVAEHYDVTKRAVTKRAASEGWAQRLEQIELAARERSDERLVETLEDMNVRHLKILKAVQGKALTTLKGTPLSSGMDAVRALEMTIRQERLIRGEPTERNAMSIEEITREEIRSLLVVVGDDEGHDESEDDGEPDDEEVE